jgi:Na+-transporting methylmalonyl-CoA/oxaloacetate decarboxylase gamma subunit
LIHLPFNLLAAMTLAEKLRDALAVTIVGMGTVFVSLYLIGELFTLLHRYFHRKVASGEPEPASPTKATHSVQPMNDPHLIPVLVAAATAALGRRVVVRRITFISRNTVSGWGEAGRASIQTSHNLRRTT